MSDNKKSTEQQPTVDQLKFQMLRLKTRFHEGFKLVPVYEHFFGTLTESEKDHLRNVWNTKVVDQKINNQVEWIAENQKQAPTFENQEETESINEDIKKTLE